MFDVILKGIMENAIMDGDSATKRYYDELKNEKFMTTKCEACNYLMFPPRSLCPKCLNDKLAWVELSGNGTLYAFSWQERGLLFSKPDVLGMVELEEGCGRLVGVITAPYEKCKTGMKVKISYFNMMNIATLPQFKPVDL